MSSRVERHLMSGCCVLAVSLFAASAANAQTAIAAEGASAQSTIETVTITGQSYALQKSIDDKRSSNVVSDGIASDEIGQTPEFGLGDALRQVPGLTMTINNGRGEDQFLTIRGLNPDYNTVTIDGMALPSTEETVRSVSLDVIPAVLVNHADVEKTWTVDQPSDAIGGVTDLHTRSAFDHPGEFFGAHLDGAYWTSTEQIKSKQPSGQGDITYSRTFGDDNQFGFLAQASYYQRSSSTLNTYTLGYSYYPYAGSGTAANVTPLEGGASTTSTTLKPGDSVVGLTPIPDRHRWYFYDNDRTRPAGFTRLDYNDHGMFRADIEAGFFEFVNNENRWSQYLNRVGNATITSPTTGSFASGSPESDFDRYVQYRELNYIQGHAAVDFSPSTRVDFTANYGVGQYRQTDDEDQFTGVTGSTYAFSYQLNAPTSALFIPNNMAAFQNPNNYNQVYHESVTDQSISHLPQTKLELTHNTDGDDKGFGFKLGWTWRDLSQRYDLTQYRLVPTGTAPTLGQIGTINKNLSLYNGEGQTMLLVDPNAVINFVAANPGLYKENASDQLTSTVNNFRLGEMINAFYGQMQYKADNFLVIAGLRFESTKQNIQNYLPVPLSSTTNFQQQNSNIHYGRLLPSINGVYDLSDDIKIRAAVTQNLARPEYAQLAENSSATFSGTQATETISNPNLKPRQATNYDLSAEWYPAPGVIASVALFDKDIHNEIITVSNTVQNASIPGTSQLVALTTTTSQNVNKAQVQGIELNLSDVKFDWMPDWMPGFLSDFGASGNLSFTDFDAPFVRMSDNTYRKLPQLIASAKTVGNASLLYSHDAWSGQLAYNYTSKMPISFDTNNQANDQWWAGMSTLDAQIMYQIDENWMVRVQGKNLTDSTPQKVVGYNQELNYSALENGRGIFFGVGATF
ncbi:MAG TPA: TonB-dependent receptor [Rhizomicrobium sp.]